MCRESRLASFDWQPAAAASKQTAIAIAIALATVTVSADELRRLFAKEVARESSDCASAIAIAETTSWQSLQSKSMIAAAANRYCQLRAAIAAADDSVQQLQQHCHLPRIVSDRIHRLQRE